MTKIIIDPKHPASEALVQAGIEVSDNVSNNNALRLGFMNLMPNPLDPVRDFGVLIGKNTAHNIHLLDFTPTPSLITQDPRRRTYRTENLMPSDRIPAEQLDALILTGFGKEDVPFEKLKFWDEVTSALDTAQQQNIPVLASCWGSHAALYHHHNVEKHCDMHNKISGVFAQKVRVTGHLLMRNIGDAITMPVSRYGRSNDRNINSHPKLKTLAGNLDTGAGIVTDGRVLYLTGHPEYPVNALPDEYMRDKKNNVPHTSIPKNVFQNSDPTKPFFPISWEQASGHLIANWIKSVQENKKQKTEMAIVRSPIKRLAIV